MLPHHPELTRERSIRFLYLKSNVFSSIFQQSLNFFQNVYDNKKLFKKKDYKIMLRGQIGTESHSFLKY